MFNEFDDASYNISLMKTPCNPPLLVSTCSTYEKRKCYIFANTKISIRDITEDKKIEKLYDTVEYTSMYLTKN